MCVRGAQCSATIPGATTPAADHANNASATVAAADDAAADAARGLDTPSASEAAAAPSETPPPDADTLRRRVATYTHFTGVYTRMADASPYPATLRRTATTLATLAAAAQQALDEMDGGGP